MNYHTDTIYTQKFRSPISNFLSHIGCLLGCDGNFLIMLLAFLWLKWARLPPAVLGPSVLSKGVEIGPTAT